MREIQLKDAKASLSAVVLSFADYERLANVPSFGRLLASSGLVSGDLDRDDTPLGDFGA